MNTTNDNPSIAPRVLILESGFGNDPPPDFGNDALGIAMADASKDDTVVRLLERCLKLEEDRVRLQRALWMLIDEIWQTKTLYELWVADTTVNVFNPVKKKERLRCYNKLIGTCQWLLSSRRIWNKAVKGYKP